MSSQKINHKQTYVSKSEAQATILIALAQGNYRVAARILWPWFKQNEQTDRIWKAIEKHDRLCVMGHAAASKTFTASIWFLCDWIAYADQTALILTSATMGAMDVRIWGDFKILWEKASIDLNSLAQIINSKHVIRKSIHDVKEAIHAVAADSDNSQTKIQGLHCARNHLIIDEADNPYSNSIWNAITNLSASGEFKAVALANPDDRNSEFGSHCEPVNGWESINPEIDFEWDSRLGWHVLRLDGLQSPNILAGEDVCPYLLNNKRVVETRDEKGTNSRSWWTYIRAWYPPDNLVSNIFSSGIVSGCSKPIIWYGAKTPVAALDPAFEGGDNCALLIGYMGRLAHQPERTAIEVNEYIRIKRKDMAKTLAFDYADQIVSILKDRAVDPKYFAIDTTGNQSSFADVIAEKYGSGMLRVNFAAGASDRKVTAEDTMPANQRYKTFVTELWYVAREWCRLGLVYLKDPPRDLRIQLESRRYELKGKDAKSGREVIMAEPKTEMKSRGLGSPDEGDAFCLLVHLCRTHALGFVPGTFRDRTPTIAKNFTKNTTVFNLNYGVPGPD